MTHAIDYNPERQYVAVQVIDTTYRKDDSGALPARIYRPEGEGPFPLLLDVHGGAWSAGGCTDNQILDMALAESGLVVVAVELRKAPACPYPSQVMDVNFATRWAKAHAGKFNAVPEGMGGLGISSGGHTLFLSAMRPMDARYGGLPLASADQFVNAYRNANGVAEIEWFADMPHNFALKAGAGTDRAINVMKAFIAGRLAIL